MPLATFFFSLQESFGAQDLLTSDQAQAIMDKQRQTESRLNDRFEKARQLQMQKLHDQMEKKRQQRQRALKQQQEKERAEVKYSFIPCEFIFSFPVHCYNSPNVFSLLYSLYL